MTTATTGQATIDIAAAPDEVYDVIADVTRMGERRPECYRCKWLDEVTAAVPGAVSWLQPARPSALDDDLHRYHG